MRDVERRIDSRELSEWIAFWKLEPPPDPYGHAALICSVVASAMGSKQYRPSDFDPRPDVTAHEPNPDTMALRLAAFAARHNIRSES